MFQKQKKIIQKDDIKIVMGKAFPYDQFIGWYWYKPLTIPSIIVEIKEVVSRIY